jgi:hypothetical protein
VNARVPVARASMRTRAWAAVKVSDAIAIIIIHHHQQQQQQSSNRFDFLLFHFICLLNSIYGLFCFVLFLCFDFLVLLSLYCWLHELWR